MDHSASKYFLFFGEKDSGRRSEEFAPLQCKPESLSEWLYQGAADPASCKMMKPGIFSAEKSSSYPGVWIRVDPNGYSPPSLCKTVMGAFLTPRILPNRIHVTF